MKIPVYKFMFIRELGITTKKGSGKEHDTESVCKNIFSQFQMKAVALHFFPDGGIFWPLERCPKA